MNSIIKHNKRIHRKIDIYIGNTIKKENRIGTVISSLLRNENSLYIYSKTIDKYLNAVIKYKFNPCGLFGLNKVKVKLEGVDDVFENKSARWDEEYKEYKLDFMIINRIKVTSRRNIIIVNSKKRNVLQFGVVGNGEYAIDFCFPFSPIQAFGLGIVSIQ
jgi:hypothetical protein